MKPIERTLNEAKSFTTTNGFGTGRVQLGPRFYSERWEVSNISVRVTGGVNAAALEARVYTGAPVPENMIGSTYDGASDSNDIAIPVRLAASDVLTCEWTNPTGTLTGAPVLTLSVYGRQIIG